VVKLTYHWPVRSRVTRADVPATVSAQWRVTRNRPHLATGTWPQVRSMRRTEST